MKFSPNTELETRLVRKLFLGQAGTAILVLGLLTRIHAATYLGGVLSTSQSWAAANSPYVLTNDTELIAGQSLTIQPGVTVRGRECQLIIKGTLTAAGTSQSNIVFAAESGYTWKGVFLSNSPNSTLSFCIISNAANSDAAIKIHSCDAQLSNCVIEDNQVRGIFLDTSASRITSCIIRRNYSGYYSGPSAGILATGLGMPKIYNCLICNNEAGGPFSAIEASGAQAIQVRNCTICFNLGGGYWDSGSYYDTVAIASCTSGNGIFANTIIYGNRDHDLAGDDEIWYTYTGYSNSLALASSPEFKNPTMFAGRTSETLNELPVDYSLVFTSPGVDSGANSWASTLSTDILGNARIQNARVDLGCYEYLPNYSTNLAIFIEPAVRVTATSEVGRNYQFRYQSTLTGSNWLTVGDIISGTGGLIGIYDTVSNGSNRFYRAFVVP